MITTSRSGKNTLEALKYLYGPGRRNEHTDPHLVASWDGFAPDPGRDGEATLAQLRDALDLHVVCYGRLVKKHVYHRMVRADPSDRNLSDEEWADIARRIVAAAGIAQDGDPNGCRWVAVHHGDNHIHILATTVRADLTQARLRGDQYRAETELTEIERQYRLKDLSDTRTPEYRAAIPKRAKSPELRKAERLGQEETGRTRLRTGVRRALAGAAGEEEFLSRLTAQGIQFEVRRLPSGDARGYKFALPTGDPGGPVWFSGSQLAADLTLPKIHERFAIGIDEPALSRPGGKGRPAAVRYRASTTTDHAVATIDDEPRAGQVAAVVSGAIEVLDTLALTSPVLSRKEINQAARALEFTAVARTRAARGEMRAMRSAARELLYGGPMGGTGGEEGTAAATILTSLVLLAIVIAKWHAAQGHRRQADAARAAADHLRAAYTRHAAKPIAHLTLEGHCLPKADHDRQADAVRRTLPADQAARLIAEDNWAALAATLAQAEAAGHDPTTLLTNAAGRRELATAASPAAVLTWRIRRAAHLPAPGPAATHDELRTSAALSRSTTRRTTTPAAGTAPQPPAPPAPPVPGSYRPKR
ncbi:relaxase/mobilization nuclease domain-containing protein [Kitasatospora sp. NPDC059817]|uniref:relaxase/mobilization nuclease domain-containing protein n=1 Tax=Kitasatospora sp. NPDC059817 TaxID=3346961 RepID=UPI00364C025D